VLQLVNIFYRTETLVHSNSDTQGNIKQLVCISTYKKAVLVALHFGIQSAVYARILYIEFM
jgi:hypothetical protein